METQNSVLTEQSLPAQTLRPQQGPAHILCKAWWLYHICHKYSFTVDRGQAAMEDEWTCLGSNKTLFIITGSA